MTVLRYPHASRQSDIVRTGWNMAYQAAGDEHEDTKHFTFWNKGGA